MLRKEADAEYMLYDFMYIGFKNRQNESSRSQRMVVWSAGRMNEKGHRGTSWHDRNIPYLVLGGSYTDVTQLSKLIKLNT